MNPFDYVPWTRSWHRRRDYELCMETAERVQEIVDGEIPPSRAADTLRTHLDACGRCQLEADEIVQLKNAIARVGDRADEHLVTKLEDLARRLCRGEEAPAD